MPESRRRLEQNLNIRKKLVELIIMKCDLFGDLSLVVNYNQKCFRQNIKRIWKWFKIRPRKYLLTIYGLAVNHYDTRHPPPAIFSQVRATGDINSYIAIDHGIWFISNQLQIDL